jgi:hypothetical protein
MGCGNANRNPAKRHPPFGLSLSKPVLPYRHPSEGWGPSGLGAYPKLDVALGLDASLRWHDETRGRTTPVRAEPVEAHPRSG